MDILNWPEVYKELSSQYFENLQKVLNDTNLTAAGKQEARKALDDGLRADWGKLEQDYTTRTGALEKELITLQDKAPGRPVPSSSDIELENREANRLLSQLAATSGRTDFLSVIKETLKGTKPERTAFAIHFHKIVELAQGLWNGVDDRDRNEVISALKGWYKDAMESIKSQAELNHEAKLQDIKDQIDQLGAAYSMAERVFKQILPAEAQEGAYNPWAANYKQAEKTPFKLYGELA
jgi:hypothetical protein